MSLCTAFYAIINWFHGLDTFCYQPRNYHNSLHVLLEQKSRFATLFVKERNCIRLDSYRYIIRLLGHGHIGIMLATQRLNNI